MTGPNTSAIALIGGVLVGQPLVDVVRGVLDDHDGVVDDDADGQDEAEESEHVDREPERGHRGEGADDRHRHGRRRDQHGPPVLEEDQDDDEDEDAGLEQGLVDLVDRLLDEQRWCRTGRSIRRRAGICRQRLHPGVAPRLATSSALAPGELEDGRCRRRACRRLSDHWSYICAPSSTRATSVTRVSDPPALLGS